MTGGAPTVAVRDATPGDAAAIADIHVRCWRHAYVGMVPDAVLDSLDVLQKVELWRAVLSGQAPDRVATLVSLDEDDIVSGFAHVGPSNGEEADPAVAVLQAIYLDPEVIGRGVGRVLLAEATDRMRGAGFTRAQLDVLPANARARRVYEAAGWRSEGEPWLVRHGDHELPHQRYVREL